MKREELEAALLADPGSSVLVEYTEYLRQKGEFDTALMALVKGLSCNPSFHKARLVLARVYYDMGCVPFTIRELKELSLALPENRSIVKLLEKFGIFTNSTAGLEQSVAAGGADLNPAPDQGSIDSAPESATVAEVEFELGTLDLLEEEEKEGK